VSNPHVGMNLPIDTDAIHPEALVAALTVGLEHIAEETTRSCVGVDWSTLTVTIMPAPADPGTSNIAIRARKLVS
jgi:hypothetical protein